MAVVLMLCFARSGGTLLNRCLGSLPNVVMLSEVNPIGTGGTADGKRYLPTLQAQADHWYGIKLNTTDFSGGVKELEAICMERKQHLVIRDWTFINFVPYIYNKGSPANHLLALESLEGRCELISFAFVRDVFDVRISRGGDIREFSKSYLRYVHALLDAKVRIFKYEDFCTDPSAILQQICQHTGLEFSESWRNYMSFNTLAGDVQHGGDKKALRRKNIRRAPRKRVTSIEISEMENCRELIEANRLLSYPTRYLSTKVEGYWPVIKRSTKRMLSSQFRKLVL